MIILNIIPEELKKEQKLEAIYAFIKKIFYILLVFLIIYSVTFSILKITMQMHLNETIKKMVLAKKNDTNYSNQIKIINNKINQVKTIQDETVLWSYFFEDILKNINSGISVSKLKIDKQNKTIILSGIAKSRQNLLDLKDALEKRKYLTGVTFPIKNLLEQTNINFEISATLETYDFN